MGHDTPESGTGQPGVEMERRRFNSESFRPAQFEFSLGSPSPRVYTIGQVSEEDTLRLYGILENEKDVAGGRATGTSCNPADLSPCVVGRPMV